MNAGGMVTVFVGMTPTAACEGVLRILRKQRKLRLGGIGASCAEAAAALAQGVDLLIIDVDLPGGGAFGLLAQRGGDTWPAVIFTALDDSKALEAFRYQPLDYILYPVDEIRLEDAFDRAVRQIIAKKLERGDGSINGALRRAREGVETALRLMVKSAGRISFVKTEDIDWVEADRDYVRIHNAGKKHLVRQRISRLEQQLPHGRFLRIHRSTIVNIDRIKELQPLSFGEYSVILHDGTRLTMSRSFREKVFQQLQSAA